MKKLLWIFFALLGVAAISPAAWAQSTPAHKVVLQLSSNDTLAWKGLMNNLRNLKAGWGDSVLIEVVAHGPGIDLLHSQRTNQLAAIASAADKGVVFYACENTLREKNIAKEALIPQARFVRMGVGHIIIRQEQGWSYLKAGF